MSGKHKVLIRHFSVRILDLYHRPKTKRESYVNGRIFLGGIWLNWIKYEEREKKRGKQM